MLKEGLVSIWELHMNLVPTLFIILNNVLNRLGLIEKRWYGTIEHQEYYQLSIISTVRLTYNCFDFSKQYV